MLMYATLLPHKKKGSELTPKQMLPFVWDNETTEQPEVDIPTVEEVLEAKKRWEQHDKKKIKKE